MFKKPLIVLGVVALIVCAVLIPPVRAAAESALAVFRVADAKTISITVTDLQDMMTTLEPMLNTREKAADNEGELSKIMEKASSGIRPISDISEFEAFPFSLPAALKDETPELHTADSQAVTITLDTAKLNATLTELGATALIDSRFDGTDITVSTPPAVMAAYKDVAFAATQSVYIDAPSDVLNSIKSALLSIPAIPEDLRIQLAAIDPKTRDIYLPVVEGLGRETNLGGTTGYLYNAGELFSVLGQLRGFADDAQQKELQQENASVLIWTKNDVLYYLAGAMSDSELSQIARSVRG